MIKTIKKKEGIALYNDDDSLNFLPSSCTPGDLKTGKYQAVVFMLDDGTFKIEKHVRIRHRSKMLKKLPHGRISETYDGAYLLTLKIFKDEEIDVKKAIWNEAFDASLSIHTS